MDKEPVRRNKKKRDPNYKKKKIAIIAAAVFGVAAIIAVIGFGFLLHFIYRYHYVPLKPNYTIADSVPETDTPGNFGVEETSIALTPIEEILDYQQAAEEALKELGMTLTDVPLDKVYNVLLIGSDNRLTGYAGRSDTVMLLSINFETHQITLTSFLRDLYVYIPQRCVYDKLNSAYQYGSVELLIDTIRHNFSIDVDRYITVDFYTFMDVVDIIGGIDVDVQEEELYWLNKYIRANNELLGCDRYDGYLEYADGSFQHLNGKQVLGYARFRYVGNADFSRTERQRKVINLAYEKLKKSSPLQMIELLDTVLPQITTNIERDEALGLIAKIPEISGYSIHNWSVPNVGDGYRYISSEDGQSHLGIDFKKYITKVYNTIYGSVLTEQPTEAAAQ